jgi:hypothetical protein
LPDVATASFSFALAALLTALLRRPLTAIALSCYLLGGVIVASVVKESHLGAPLTLSDLQFFFRDPIDDLELFLNYPSLGADFLAIILAAVLIVFAGLRIEAPRLPSVRGQIAAFALALGAALLPMSLSASVTHAVPVPRRRCLTTGTRGRPSRTCAASRSLEGGRAGSMCSSRTAAWA